MPSGPADVPNVTLRLTMAVDPPGAVKCHPSRNCGMPSQVPVVAKVAAVMGVGVLESS